MTCCAQMTFEFQKTCDMHPDRFDCADALLARWHDGRYGIIIHDGGGIVSIIAYCPWCGSRLPEGPLEP